MAVFFINFNFNNSIQMYNLAVLRIIIMYACMCFVPEINKFIRIRICAEKPQNSKSVFMYRLFMWPRLSSVLLFHV